MIRKLLDGSHNLESYVDDVFGHTENWSKHMDTFRDFFERVRKANLCLRPSKCKTGFDQVKFLGHELQGDCIKPQDESVGRILNTERPKTKKSCRIPTSAWHDKFLSSIHTKLWRGDCSSNGVN